MVDLLELGCWARTSKEIVSSKLTKGKSQTKISTLQQSLPAKFNLTEQRFDLTEIFIRQKLQGLCMTMGQK